MIFSKRNAWMGSLSGNISANLLSNAWSAVLMLLLTPLYIGFLGIESYGLIGLYLTWIAILGILDVGISATGVQEIAWRSARPEEKSGIPTLLRSLEVVYWAIVLALGAGVLAWAWVFGAGWFQVKGLSPELVQQALMLMAVSLVIQVPSGLYISGLMGLQRQVLCSSFIAFFGTVRGIGAVVALWSFEPDIRVFFLWQILASVLQTGVMRHLLWGGLGNDQHQAKFSLETLRSVKKFAGGITLVTALSVVMTQIDKMILSRVISMEALGFYMLAWTLASGLSRVSTPLIQAFGPHFTELASRVDKEELVRKLHLASQIMNVLILPPAAIIIFFSERILTAWTGNPTIGVAAAPILSVVVAGMALSFCSYPALSCLISRKQFGSLVTINSVSLIVLLPPLVVTSIHIGVMGAAFCWCAYGLTQYVAYQIYGQRDLPSPGIFVSILRDFLAPGFVSFAIAGVASYCLSDVQGRMTLFILLCVGLLICWFAALLTCRDLLMALKGVVKLKGASDGSLANIKCTREI